MPSIRSSLVVLCLPPPGSAVWQGSPPATIRATIQSVSTDSLTLKVRTREGEERVVRLNHPHPVNAAIPASLADIKPGTYIGTAALPGSDSALKAIEAHMLPPSRARRRRRLSPVRSGRRRHDQWRGLGEG